jgi:ankyrin repeat protein
MVVNILQRSPSAALATDNEGRLPLHYAAAVKDGGHIYNLLVEAGADENALDNVSISYDSVRWNMDNHYVWNSCAI